MKCGSSLAKTYYFFGCNLQLLPSVEKLVGIHCMAVLLAVRHFSLLVYQF